METLHLLPATLDFSTLLDNHHNEEEHCHSFFELFYIKSGSVTHVTLNQTETLGLGEACLICPGVSHKFIRGTETCEQRNVLIRPNLMKKVCDFIDETLFDGICTEKVIRFKFEDSDLKFIEHRFSLFLSDAYSDAKRKNLEKLLVANFLNFIYMGTQSSVNTSLDFKNRCLQAINNHYIDPNAIAFVWAELGYNKVYLSKKFKQEFGVTITEYILSLRLNHAAFLLTTTSCSIEECCHAIGLESLTYFINSFKKKYGMTPAKYRKQSVDK